jgi:hypothetical protein
MPAEEVTDREFQMHLAKLGIEAEHFQYSALGKYLYDRAEVQIESSTAELILTDPDDVKANTDIRNKINVGKMFIQWIEEAINSGKAAETNIEIEDSEDE